MKIIFDKPAKGEFSKSILAAVMVLYFIGAAFGGAIIYMTREGLEALFAYIGAPTATAIGFYAWKAKNENVRKIGNNVKEDNGDEDRLEAQADQP